MTDQERVLEMLRRYKSLIRKGEYLSAEDVKTDLLLLVGRRTFDLAGFQNRLADRDAQIQQLRETNDELMKQLKRAIDYFLEGPVRREAWGPMVEDWRAILSGRGALR